MNPKVFAVLAILTWVRLVTANGAVASEVRAAALPGDAVADGGSQEVMTPPEEFFLLVDEGDRATALSFYKKYLDIGGLPVVAAQPVADAALIRTRDIVSHLLAGRPDILRAMKDSGMYLIIIGKDQVLPPIGSAPLKRANNSRLMIRVFTHW